MKRVFFHRVAFWILLLGTGSAAVMLARAQESVVVRGVVQGEAGPVAGAVVRLRGSAAYVQTDAQGRFQLTIQPERETIPLTAWSPGYFVAGGLVADFTGATGGVLHLEPHPVTDHADYAFISPVLAMDNATACGHCHRDHTGEADGALPVDEWLRDAHSGAATNPRFLSLYNGTALDGTSGDLTTFAFDPVQGVSVPVAPSLGSDQVGPGFKLDFPEQIGSCATCHVPLLALEDPYHADPNLAVGTAAEGIPCDFCHKLQDVRLRPEGLPDPGLPGVQSLRFLRPGPDEQVFIGPFDDTPGDDIYSALQDESQLCAACHTGQFWDVKIYDSFGEWLNSPYSDPDTGQTCQDCHMPHTGVTTFVQLPPEDMASIAPRDPATIFSHQMPGAADQTLLENTATLEVESQSSGERLQVTVRVTNTGAGHHIPTDNPLRHLILWVRAVDRDGQPLTLLAGPTIPTWGGAGDPAAGYYAGQPGVLYAKILADAATGETPTAAYWRPTRLVSDNRIPALATDETTYTFALPADAIFQVDVRLYLRRAFIDLMGLKGWDTPDRLLEQQMVNRP